MPGRTPLVGRDATIGRAVGVLTGGGAGVVLAGPAGIGRTRLLEACASRAAESGFLLAHDWAAAAVPPGAVVVVDDLHLLDADDARTLAEAVQRGEVRLLGTLRTGMPAPPPVTSAWRDGEWERVDVEPLGRADIAELASHVAGLPVDGISVQRLLTWTGGLPAELTAVLASPVAGGWFDARGPVATLRPGFPLAAARELHAGSPIEAAPPDVRAAGELVALGRRVPDRLLVALAGNDTVAAAEARGIVQAVGDGPELAWQPASPLQGELTRAVLTPERARRARADLAAAFRAEDVREPHALLVQGEACLERGVTDEGDVATLVDAADVALEHRDVDTATRLARGAWEHGESMEAALLLGSVYELVGDQNARVDIASDALALAADDRSRVIAAEQLATALSTLDRHHDAVATVERTRRLVADPLWAGRLDALLANLLLHEARLDDAVALAEPYLGVPLAAPDAALMVAVARAVGGRTRDALAVTETGSRALDAVAGEHRTAMPSLLHVAAGIAHTEAGDLDDADETIGPVYDAGVARGDNTAQAWAALSLGRVALVRGAVRSAARWFRDALAGFGEQHQTGYVAWAYSGLAGAAALAGDLAEARRAAHAWEHVGSHAVRLYEPDSRRCTATVALADGDPTRAATILRDAAEQARATGQYVVEVACLHDLARLGEAEEAARLVSDGARGCDGRLAPARLAHVDALARRDTDRMEQAAAEFERIGAWLLAAEAWAGLADLGSGRAAARAALRAHAAAARCEGAQPPRLAGLDRPTLSARAREIAELAAAGLSRAAVAEHLHLSRHTVNRHVQDAYESLGVAARDELPDALAHLAEVEGRGGTPAGPGEPWPFVGREAELATLRAEVSERRQAGVALIGRSGVGKTRLARELEQELAAQGWATTTVVAGATSGLALSDAASRLVSGGPNGLLVVDDAQQLDLDGAAGLRRVLARREVFVVLTVRTDDPAARRAQSEWSRRDLTTVTVAPLGPDEVGRLLASALGGPVLRPTSEALADASGGNPLWLRELVHAARTETTLQPRDGVWQLTEVGRPNPRLVDLVQSHLVPLDADARAVLGGLAVAGPLPGPLVEQVIGAPVVERLERTGLVERDAAGALQLAHPIYGDVLRTDLPTFTRRAWYARLVDASLAVGPETVDAVQLVTWRLEAGVDVPTQLMVAAAERALALGDLAAAERLAGRALTAGAPVATHLVLARVSEARGDLQAAARAYDSAAASPDPVVRARATLAGAELMAWSTGEVADSRALLEAGLAAAPPDPWPDILRAGLASVHALAARGGPGLPVADAPRSDVPAARLRELVLHAGLKLTTGRIADAADDVGELDGLVEVAGTPLLAALATELELFVLASNGRLEEAVSLAQRRRAVAVAAGDRAAQSGCDLAAGRLALLQGRPATAAARFRDALTDPLVRRGTHRWREAQLGLARALATAGSVEAATEELAVARTAAPSGDVRVSWARAWIELAAHERDRAAARLEAGAELAGSAGAMLVAVFLLHHALLADPTPRVASQLRALEGRVNGAVPEACLAHAAAVETRDPAELYAAAERFALVGFEHSAAEVAATAAVLAAAEGLPALADRAGRAAARRRAACEGAIRLTVIPDVPAARLSPRQQQIAEFAAEGRSAKQIADALGLSIRTVENHLQAAYERLGVNRRADLADVLGAA